MAYGNFKGLHRRTIRDNVLRDKAFNIAKNLECERYQRGLSSMFINSLIRNLQVEQLKMKLFSRRKNWQKNDRN